jgi:hypothetical protein
MTRDEKGRMVKKDEPQADNVSLRTNEKPTQEYGNKVTYLTDRLRRQSPDIFEALRRGEYPSIHAAATAAGIRSKMTQHIITVDGFARAAIKYLSAEQIAELIAVLSEEAT